MSSRRQVTWLISVLTLAAQLLGLVHLVVEDHTLSVAGQVMEPVVLADEVHEHAGAHLCATAPMVAPEPDPGCAVAASWNTSALLGEPPRAEAIAAGASTGVAGGQQGAHDDDVLARAPKGSPPSA